LPKFGRKVPRIPYQFQGQTVRVTRPINSDTQRAPYLPNATAYELTACRWRPQANTNLVYSLNQKIYPPPWGFLKFLVYNFIISTANKECMHKLINKRYFSTLNNYRTCVSCRKAVHCAVLLHLAYVICSSSRFN